MQAQVYGHGVVGQLWAVGQLDRSGPKGHTAVMGKDKGNLLDLLLRKVCDYSRRASVLVVLLAMVVAVHIAVTPEEVLSVTAPYADSSCLPSDLQHDHDDHASAPDFITYQSGGFPASYCLGRPAASVLRSHTPDVPQPVPIPA